MSKMSDIHLDLTEQANELGFESIGEAEQAGYGVDWKNIKLIKVEDEQDKAHEAWLKEQQIVLGDLMNLMVHKVYDHDIIERAYKFIKEQCHD